MSASVRRSNEDEDDLKWAALEKLPTYNRLTVSLLQREQSKSGHQRHDQVDVRTVDQALRHALLDRLVGIIDQDNEFFVQKLRERIDRVGISLPEVEVRYGGLRVDAEGYVGGRAMPTLINSALNTVEADSPSRSAGLREDNLSVSTGWKARKGSVPTDCMSRFPELLHTMVIRCQSLFRRGHRHISVNMILKTAYWPTRTKFLCKTIADVLTSSPINWGRTSQNNVALEKG